MANPKKNYELTYQLSVIFYQTNPMLISLMRDYAKMDGKIFLNVASSFYLFLFCLENSSFIPIFHGS